MRTDEGALFKASDHWLDQLEGQVQPVIRRMGRHYSAVELRLLKAIDRLETAFGSTSTPPSLAQLYKMERYFALLGQVRAELTQLGQDLAPLAQDLSDKASLLGAQSGIHLGLLAVGDRSPMAKGFEILDPALIARMSSFVQPSSPLYQSLSLNYGEGWANAFAEQIVQGVALGWNPRKVFRQIRQTVSLTIPSHLLTNVRTAQLYAYRTTQQTTWTKSGVVDYWIWSSARDLRTCGSCISKHGSRHPVTTVMHDHHNGRCAMIPHTVGAAGYPAPDLNIPTGETWFRGLTPETQQVYARSGGWLPQYRAWRDGAIRFEQLSHSTDNPIYGKMDVQSSLVSLLGTGAERYYSRNGAH